MKYLVWIAIIVALVWLVKPRRNVRTVDPHARTENPSARRANFEAIVACTHCGLHVPDSEALKSASGAAYCSNAHRNLHDDR